MKHCHKVSQLAHALDLRSTRTTYNVICSCVPRTRSSPNTCRQGELKEYKHIQQFIEQNTHIKGTPSFSLTTHGHHHVIHVLRLLLIISSYRYCPTYKPPLVERIREHSLFRATTQRMLVLPSILSHNSRNTLAFDP